MGPGTGLRDRAGGGAVYLCTDARQRQRDLPGFVDAVLGAGVDIVQLRHKGLEARQEMACLEVLRRACDRHGALLSVKDRAGVARAVGADVLHLGQQDLPVPVAREIIGAAPLIGRPTHTEAEARGQDQPASVPELPAGSSGVRLALAYAAVPGTPRSCDP